MDREQENDSVEHSSRELEVARLIEEERPEEDSDDSLADIRHLEQVMDDIIERQERAERNREQDGQEIRAEDFVELPRDDLLGEPDFWHSITAQVNRVRDTMRAVRSREDDTRREILERVDHHFNNALEIYDAMNEELEDAIESISDIEDMLHTRLRGMNLQDPYRPSSSRTRQNTVPVQYNSAGEEIYTSEEE